VLQLVDAVEEYGHQIGRFLAQQVLRDSKPLALARQVIANPLLAVVVAQLVTGLLLLVEIPRELVGAEFGNRLEPVVKVQRMGIATQMARGYEARDDEAGRDPSAAAR
jgi:hypothetical protein